MAFSFFIVTMDCSGSSGTTGLNNTQDDSNNPSKKMMGNFSDMMRMCNEVQSNGVWIE
jgi:hypothetical protein